MYFLGLLISFGDCAFARSELGKSLETGDVNGDGIVDIIIGAPSDSTSPVLAGLVAVVYGRSNYTSQSIDLCTLSNATGVIFLGQNGQNGRIGDGAGSDLAVGDFNNDRVPDIIVGAPSQGANGSGAVYIVFGRQGGWTNYLNPLYEVNNTEVQWISLSGSSQIVIGNALAAGDINRLFFIFLLCLYKSCDCHETTTVYLCIKITVLKYEI